MGARLRTASLGAGAYRAARALSRSAVGSRAGASRWERTNYAGRTVTLLGGVGVALAATVAAVGTPQPAGAVIAALGGGTFGAVDDLRADSASSSKGLRGHLGALATGEVTTGALKVIGIGASGLAASLVLTPRPRTALDVAVGAGLVAGTANLLNLFDLRPGRALKVAIALAGTGAALGSARSAGALGVALAALGDDLGERTMLGDTGANALGALIGSSIAASTSRTGRCVTLAWIAALTLASERVSFSKVITTNPVLRAIDGLGRLRGEPSR